MHFGFIVNAFSEMAGKEFGFRVKYSVWRWIDKKAARSAVERCLAWYDANKPKP